MIQSSNHIYVIFKNFKPEQNQNFRIVSIISLKLFPWKSLFTYFLTQVLTFFQTGNFKFNSTSITQT